MVPACWLTPPSQAATPLAPMLCMAAVLMLMVGCCTCTQALQRRRLDVMPRAEQLRLLLLLQP